MEKFLDSMVIVARSASRNVRMFPLTVLFTFTMVIIINCILGLINGILGATATYVPSYSASIIAHNFCLIYWCQTI